MGANAEMVKIIDVAREAARSVATVSRPSTTTTGSTPYSPPACGARPEARLSAEQHSRATCAGQRTSLWMLIISDIENAFFTSVARGVEDVAVATSYSVVLCNADEDDAQGGA